MSRSNLALILVITIAYVIADGKPECIETKDCMCGSICFDERCHPGCQLFDVFIEAGSDSVVYGRKCSCGDIADERGMVLKCETNVEFIGAPEGVTEWKNSPACSE